MMRSTFMPEMVPVVASAFCHGAKSIEVSKGTLWNRHEIEC